MNATQSALAGCLPRIKCSSSECTESVDNGNFVHHLSCKPGGNCPRFRPLSLTSSRDTPVWCPSGGHRIATTSVPVCFANTVRPMRNSCAPSSSTVADVVNPHRLLRARANHNFAELCLPTRHAPASEPAHLLPLIMRPPGASIFSRRKASRTRSR